MPRFAQHASPRKISQAVRIHSRAEVTRTYAETNARSTHWQGWHVVRCNESRKALPSADRSAWKVLMTERHSVEFWRTNLTAAVYCHSDSWSLRNIRWKVEVLYDDGQVNAHQRHNSAMHLTLKSTNTVVLRHCNIHAVVVRTPPIICRGISDCDRLGPEPRHSRTAFCVSY